MPPGGRLSSFFEAWEPCMRKQNLRRRHAMPSTCSLSLGRPFRGVARAPGERGGWRMVSSVEGEIMYVLFREMVFAERIIRRLPPWVDAQIGPVSPTFLTRFTMQTLVCWSLIAKYDGVIACYRNRARGTDHDTKTTANRVICIYFHLLPSARTDRSIGARRTRVASFKWAIPVKPVCSVVEKHGQGYHQASARL